jgi:hypothetical protein
MKQLHVITPAELFPIPLARTTSLKTAKAKAELIANRGVWVETTFLTPSIIKMIEIVDVEPPTKNETNEASIPVPVDETPVPTPASQEQPSE